MQDLNDTNYRRIAAAIDYLRQNFRSQPSLEDVAAHAALSPAHFQRIFSDWAGTSPKKFLQYLSIAYAKGLLSARSSLAEAAYETGLSGTGRLHDLFINIEGMTPAEYRNGGENLRISYGFYASPFGKILVASTPRGICRLSFTDDEAGALQQLQKTFPNARFIHQKDALHEAALQIFGGGGATLPQIRLHLKGTPFQLKVWQALLQIPEGGLSTYSRIAASTGHSGAVRAAGTAIGSNPVAYLIPCHRVIRTDGGIGGYRWGETRKNAMIGRELFGTMPKE